MIKKTSNDSEYKQRNWKIRLTAGIAVLTATGMAAYFIPTEPTAETIRNPKQAETVQALQQIETQEFTYGMVYEKRYDDKEKGLDIILLNSPSGSTKMIGNFKNITASHALNSGDGQPPTNLTGTPYFYTISNEDNNEGVLKKIDLAGQVVQKIPLGNNPTTLGISKQEDMVAWCNFQEEGSEEQDSLTIFNLITKTRTTLPDPIACSLGSHRITFSQNGDKVYYTRYFYELYGEFSDEEFKELSKENENGLHAIDLMTKKSSVIEPNYEGVLEITFWNDSNVQLSAGFMASPSRGMDTITFKRLPNRSFDYLTQSQIAALTTLDTLKIPGKYFLNYLITEDGKGVFYNVSDDKNRSSTELGYYNFETKQYHALEAKTQNNSSSISLFAALDEQHLYYLANPGNISGTTILYETDFTGTQRIIDSGSGIQKITSVKK